MRFSSAVLATQAPPLSPLMERAARVRAEGRDLFVLAQAMVDYDPPPAFPAALQKALTEGGPALHGYAPDPGIPELRAELAGYLARSFGLTRDPESEILVTPGANHAAYLALSTLLEPGDEALLISPWYFNHEMTLRLLGAKARTITARAEEGFAPRIAEIRDAWSPELRVILLVNPNNPTGACYPHDWIASFEESLRSDPRWDEVWILSDQTYQEIHFTGAHPRSPVPRPERTLTVGSFSKCFALAGWRLGFITGPSGFIEQALKVQDSSVICAPRGPQRALAHVLSRPDRIESYLGQKRTLLERRRNALLRPLRSDRRLRITTPAGACFAFVGLPEGTDGERFAWDLLEKEAVFVVPGVHFGPEWRSFVRLSFGSGSEDRLAEAGSRIIRAMG